MEVLFSLPEEGTTEDRRQFLPCGLFYSGGVGMEIGSLRFCLGFVFLEGSVRKGSSVLILPPLKMFKPRVRPGTRSDSNVRTEPRNKIVVIRQKCSVRCPIVSVCESLKDESLMCVRPGMCT